VPAKVSDFASLLLSFHWIASHMRKGTVMQRPLACTALILLAIIGRSFQPFIHLERSRALSEQTFRSLVSADRLDRIVRAWCLSLHFRSSNPVARDIFVERTGQLCQGDCESEPKGRSGGSHMFESRPHFESGRQRRDYDPRCDFFVSW
jgi:hypothetical protein